MQYFISSQNRSPNFQLSIEPESFAYETFWENLFLITDRVEKKYVSSACTYYALTASS